MTGVPLFSGGVLGAVGEPALDPPEPPDSYWDDDTPAPSVASCESCGRVLSWGAAGSCGPRVGHADACPVLAARRARRAQRGQVAS